MRIFFCADDYGLNKISSDRIMQCVTEGALNKISVFPNFGDIDTEKPAGEKVTLSLHLNLVEGKCVSDKVRGSLIADEDGRFLHTFGGLLKCNIFNPKRFEEAVSEEVRAQILLWKKSAIDGAGLYIDSHQHTHMIPGVFRAIMNTVRSEGLFVEYLRIPAEPVAPFLLCPSLYFTYSPVNLIKQWLLKFLWAVNKKETKGLKIPTGYFFGVLFSGNMDEKRVRKVYPHYLKLAKKNKRDIEVLFHPGYIRNGEVTFGDDIAFEKFYLSDGRKTEFDTLQNISNSIKKEELKNALY